MSTLNLQVGADADDGYSSAALGFSNVGYNYVGNYIGSFPISCFSRFTGVSGLSGATISSAVFSCWGTEHSAGSPLTTVYAADAASPAAPTTNIEYNAVTVTAASVNWDVLMTNNAWNTKDISSIIQELADSYDPTTILLLHKNRSSVGSSTNLYNSRDTDGATTDAAKLDIDYTAGGAANPKGPLGNPFAGPFGGAI